MWKNSRERGCRSSPTLNQFVMLSQMYRAWSLSLQTTEGKKERGKKLALARPSTPTRARGSGTRKPSCQVHIQGALNRRFVVALLSSNTFLLHQPLTASRPLRHKQTHYSNISLGLAGADLCPCYHCPPFHAPIVAFRLPCRRITLPNHASRRPQQLPHPPRPTPRLDHWTEQHPRQCDTTPE